MADYRSVIISRTLNLPVISNVAILGRQFALNREREGEREGERRSEDSGNKSVEKMTRVEKGRERERGKEGWRSCGKGKEEARLDEAGARARD